MKKNLKRIFAALIAMAMLLTAVPVWAAAPATTTTVYIKAGKNVFEWIKDSKKPKNGTLRTREMENGCIFMYTYGTKVKNIKSSNRSRLTAAKYMDGILKARLKKAGTTTVSYSAWDSEAKKRKTYKNICKVYNYQNPLASFKIGNQDYASTFNNSPFSSFDWKQTAKGKLSVKLNKGWKLISIRQATGESSYSTLLSFIGNHFKTLKNNQTVTTKKGAIEVLVYNRAQKYYTSVIFATSPNSNMIAG